MNVVISQSMYFPWIGLLEQIKLADYFVHYDDVQFSKGSFVNRVQIKTPKGMQWLTVPLSDYHFGQKINEIQIKPENDWREHHLDLLKNSFVESPFASDALQLAEEVLSSDYSNLAEIARASLLALAKYFDLDIKTRFIDVDELDIKGSNTDRVLSVVKNLKGTRYITGHGAAQYLDHQSFENEGIDVRYMDYRCIDYPQRFGAFTPYLSSLDLVAQCGHEGIKYIFPKTIPWKEFINAS